jgi:hypothetical protein
MIKTQHCPNCEATEQKLHDFKQKVSDAVETYFKQENYLGKFNDTLGQFIIPKPKPKPDPLVDAVESVLSGFESRKHAESYANKIRAALDALGFEIREKNDDQ